MPKPKKAKEVAPGRDTRSAKEKRDAFMKVSSTMKLQDSKVLREETEAVLSPFGSVILDDLFLLGGIPGNGRVVHIHGAEFSNKSTTGYHAIKSYQNYTGEPAVIFDFEKTGTLSYIEGLGVNVDESMLRLVPVDDIQDACQKSVQFMREAGVKMFMYDSIPRMKQKVDYKDILSGDAFKNTVGAHARAMSLFYDTLLPYASEVGACMLMINQTRARIEASREAAAALKYPSFTNLPYTLPGGKATRFVASVMLELNLKQAWRSDKAPDDPFLWDIQGREGEFLVHEVAARILKNKVTNGGYRSHSLYYRPGKGLDDNISVRQLAREMDYITYAGKKWVVGELEKPLATFENKEECIKALVQQEDPKLIGGLRKLVSDRCFKDNAKYSFELDETERSYVVGEKDFVGDGAEGDEVFAVDDVKDTDGLGA